MIELAKDYSDIGAPDGYIPEFDYRGRGYRPFKKEMEEGTGPGACPLCERCKSYYRLLYDKGITRAYVDAENQVDEQGDRVPEPTLLPYCQGDYSERIGQFSPEDFDSEEEYYTAVTLLDPVRWAQAELNWHPRWFQKEVLRCSSQFRAIRAGRRIGKTEGMAVYVLWKAWTNQNFNILVVAPYQAQVERFFEILRTLLSQSVSLQGSLDKNRQQPHEMISFRNGSKIKGFSSGARSSAKSDQIRGQDANLIVLDEADYLADADLETISAILASEKDVEMMVSSTPTGIRQKLHKWATNKTERFKEFWFISSESPSWTKKAESLFRSNYSESGYAREFLAEFGMEMVGVFRAQDIERSIKDYKLSDCARDAARRYVIGVDWNKSTGTHIVVVENRKEGDQTRYRLVDKMVIRRSEFTQHEAVQAIMELDLKWHPEFIYVDAGFGHVQVEMFWKYDKDHPERQTNYRKRLVPVEMGGNTVIRNPVTGEDEKKPTKPFLVNLLAAQLENGRIEVPKEEDTQVRILPEEIEIARIGLVQQMRDFKVTKYSPQGRPTYSQDYEHTLTAFMCAVGGFVLEFSDLRQVPYVPSISSVNQPGMGPAPRGPDIRLRKRDEAARRERLQPRDRVAGMGEGSVKTEPSPEKEPGMVLKGIKGKAAAKSDLPDAETVEDHIKLYNTGKAPIRLVRKNRGVYRKHRRGGGYRRSNF